MKARYTVWHKWHVTAVDRRAVIAGMEAGHREWQTPRKRFKIIEESGDTFVVLMTEWPKDDFGRTIERFTHLTVRKVGEPCELTQL
jgi:hypothetical protein